jgi:multicomponent Na+:H+ antiporter subunit G
VTVPQLLGVGLIAVGTLLVLLAGVGIIRFSDTLMRVNVATKAAGLGVAAILAGVAFEFGTPEAAIKLTIAVFLQFATAPVAGHVIGRAAYRAGVPLWEGTHVDDLRGFRERPRPAPTADGDELR